MKKKVNKEIAEKKGNPIKGVVVGGEILFKIW
jgi:hypothetical protein